MVDNKDQNESEKRRFIRFAADPGQIAEIDLFPQRPQGEFQPNAVGLILDESFKGCGLVILQTEKLQVGEKVKIKVGKLHPLKAQVRWRAQIDPRVLKIGLEFLE